MSETDTGIDSFIRQVARTPELSASHALSESALLGRRIRQYRITRLIGRGGMGQVFAAEDHLLGREVAIKLLPPAFTAELRQRFLREARSLARIQHPAVATFYEAGEDGGLAFLAMEYVAGETLRESLARGPLPADRTLELFSGLLEGLAHIHHVGLVHRDIKPENVAVTPRGTAKLLDLGIATAIHASVDGGYRRRPRDRGVTEVGAIVGSLEYMAPEQLAGEPLDGRADLFSVGVMLFECVTGRHPFRGADRAETRRRILEGEVAAVEPDVISEDLRAMLERAMATDREARYPSVATLLRDVRALAAGAIAGPGLADSIAVLPFADRGGADWAGAAVAEALRRQLGREDRIAVVSREQTEALSEVHGQHPIGFGLAGGFRWVVSGRIERDRGRWRARAELFNPATDTAVEQWDASADELTAAAASIAEGILEAIGLAGDPLHGHLAPADLIARAMEMAQRRLGQGDYREAMELLEEALRLEPDHIDALVQLGSVAGLLYTATRSPALAAAARASLERAVELEPDHPLANQWLGYNLSARRRLVEAEAHFARALRTAPDNWQHHYFHAGSLLALPLEAVIPIARRVGVSGDVEPVAWRRAVALGELRTAATLAPRNAFAYWGLGAIQYELGNYDEAIFALERAVELERVSPLATGGIAAFLAEAYRRAGLIDRAREAALAALDTTEANDHVYRDLFRSVALCALGRALLDLDNHDAARAAFEQSRLLLEGRPTVRSGGNVLVQSLAGLACSGDDGSLERAKRLFEDRETHSFDWVHMCGDDFALAQVARACVALGDPEARSYIERARVHGAIEAMELEVR